MSDSDLRLVVGLGNPGPGYAANRHNVGQMVVDELANRMRSSFKSHKANAVVAEGRIVPGGPRFVLAKPNTYMNVSGGPVNGLLKFYGIAPEHLIVVHDELDIPFDTLKLKQGGGHGGHNGLRSLIEQLGGNGFARLRMGIGRDPNAKPGAKDAAGWVLSDFPKAQASALDAVIRAGCEDVETVLAKGIKDAMNQHNARSNLAAP